MKENRITRRRILKGIGMAAGAAALGIGLPRAAKAENVAEQVTRNAPSPEEAERPWYELGMMADPILDNVLLFYLGHTWQGLADIGECLDTASRINADDEYSWPQEWLKTAERVRGYAEQSEAGGHKVSAGEAYLRAANYYMAALHRHPEPKDPEVQQMAEQSVPCFIKALELLSIPAQPVEIPYEGTTLPGYFFRSPIAGERAPVLIVHQGRDGWAEHCKFLADGAIKRGYHCLLFDGPGQGKVIRLQGLPFRPDWEKVITPVVDFAINTPGVDPDRIALMGISMGGALAPRAAAFEKRLKICIANPGVYRWADIFYGFIAAFNPDLIKLLETDPQAFNAQMEELARGIPLIGWGLKDSMWKHGATSPADLMIKMKDFTNEGITDQITCRMLIMDGTADDFSQGKKLYEALKCPKDYMLFTEEDTGLVHCQTGALAVSSQRMFDWLDEYI